jgi:hypothetical protein
MYNENVFQTIFLILLFVSLPGGHKDAFCHNFRRLMVDLNCNDRDAFSNEWREVSYISRSLLSRPPSCVSIMLERSVLCHACHSLVLLLLHYCLPVILWPVCDNKCLLALRRGGGWGGGKQQNLRSIAFALLQCQAEHCRVIYEL